MTPKIALGAWAWGNDGTFGNDLTEEELRPVFDAGQKAGLNLWDTAYVYGMGKSEHVLGKFLRTVPRESYLISTKFTPQCADMSAKNPVTAMYEGSAERLGTKFIDYFWIHNPVGAPEWTRKLIPLAKSGNIGHIGLSNHNLAELVLTDGEIRELEALTDKANINTVRIWEKEVNNPTPKGRGLR